MPTSAGIRSKVHIPAALSEKPATANQPALSESLNEPKSPNREKGAVKPSNIKKWSEKGETHIEDIDENKKRPLVSRLKSKLSLFEKGHQDEEQLNAGSSKKDKTTGRKDREEQRRGKQRDSKSKKVESEEEEEESESEEEHHRRKKRDKKKKEEKKKREKKKKEKKKKQDERDKKQKKKVDGISDILSAGNQVLSEKDDFTHTLDALSDLIGEEDPFSRSDALDSIINQTMSLASSDPTTKPVSPTKKMSLQKDHSRTHQTSSSSLLPGRRLKGNQSYQNIPERRDFPVSQGVSTPPTSKPPVHHPYFSSPMPPPPIIASPPLSPQPHPQAHSQGTILPTLNSN